MNRNQSIPEEWLDAYFDGELSSEECAAVERWLAASAEHRRDLARIQWLAGQLDKLPRERLDGDLAARVLSRLAGGSSAADSDPRSCEWSEDLLSGYVDGELTDAQRELVERRLARDPEAVRRAAELREINAELGRLPRRRLGDDFTARVMAAIGQVDPEGPAEPGYRTAESEELAVEPGSARPASTSSRRGQLLWAVAAVAAAALLILSTLPFSRWLAAPDVARTSGGQDERAETRRPEAPEGGDPGLRAADPPDNDPALAENGRGVPDAMMLPPAQWVSHLGQDLLVVYELTLTPEGVQRDAFSQLLEQHQISLAESRYALTPRQRQLLLRHRFLEGVRSIDEETANMDSVHLYLLSCKVVEAASIYADLVTQHEDFGSFFMNLTNRFANQAVLNQICEDSGIQEDRRQAVELLGRFAIFSRSARNLGVFGALRLDPDDLSDLFGQREPKPEPAPRAMDEADWEASLRGEEACEVLFVVRHLEPLDDGGAAER